MKEYKKNLLFGIGIGLIIAALLIFFWFLGTDDDWFVRFVMFGLVGVVTWFLASLWNYKQDSDGIHNSASMNSIKEAAAAGLGGWVSGFGAWLLYSIGSGRTYEVLLSICLLVVGVLTTIKAFDLHLNRK